MAMYARVEQGVVRELVETDQRIEELYHPDLLWVWMSRACLESARGGL